MDKTNIIVYSSIGIIVLAMILYIIVVFGKKTTNVKEEFNVPDLVLSESKEDYLTRIEKAKAYQPQDDKIETNNNLEFKIYNDTTEKKDEIKKEVENIEGKQKAKKKQRKTRKKRKAPVKTETKKEIAVQEKQEDEYTNYGLIVNKKEKAIMMSDDFIEAFLIKDIKIKNGTQMVFILNKSMEVKNLRFNKMSRIFAVARYSSNNVDIVANVIQNTDGKKYPIRMIGYNENYQKGIFDNTKVDEKVNKGKNKVLDDASLLIPSTEIRFVSSVLNSAGQATKDVFKKEPEIHISEGYRMYFKYEEL